MCHNEWRHNLSTGGFLREDARTKRITPNEYIRVTDKDRGNLLYKIKDFTSIVYIYPLTNLQQNETSYWSANEDNNKTLWHKDIYEAIIQQSFNEFKLQNTITCSNSFQRLPDHATKRHP